VEEVEEEEEDSVVSSGVWKLWMSSLLVWALLG
jgi:hypothetical protein